MSLFSNQKRPIASFLLLAIFVSFILGPVVLFYPKKAKAFIVPVSDQITHALLIPIVAATSATAGSTAVTAGLKIWEKAEYWLDLSMRTLGQILLRQVLAMVTNEIIRWISGGGKPKFVSDWKGFLADAADATAGKFIDEHLGLGFLCEPFDLDIKIALLPVPTFDERVRCTLSDIVDNIEGFYEDFTKGGWRGWIELVEPQNNIYGAYLMAFDEKMAVAAAAREAAEKEAMSGEGFLGAKDEFGRIITPARMVSEVAGRAITQEIDLLRDQIADLTDTLGPYQIYVVAIANALINRVIKEGLGLIGIGTNRAYPQGAYSEEWERGERPAPPAGCPYSGGGCGCRGASGRTPPSVAGTSEAPVYYATYAEQERNMTQNLKENQEILKKNLGELKNQQSLSLEVLGQIKQKQEEILKRLQANYADGLSLPDWAGVEELSLSLIQITATDIGSITLTKTETVTKGTTITTYIYTTFKIEPQAQARIDEMTNSEDGIDEAGKDDLEQRWIRLVDMAIRQTQNFITICNQLLTTYQRFQPSIDEREQTQLETLEDKRQKAKEEVFNSAQALIGSENNMLDGLNLETTITASNVNLRTINLESARGTKDTPAIGTLYGELDQLNTKLGETFKL